MKSRNVHAQVRVDCRQISAHFRPSTGRLVISDGGYPRSHQAPDSWMALATVNSDSNWGTRPTSADLQVFLERYIAEHPRFDRS